METPIIYAADVVIPFTTERKDDKGTVIDDGVPVVTGTLRPLTRKELKAFREGPDTPEAAYALLVDHLKTWSIPSPISAIEIDRLREPLIEALVVALIVARDTRRGN